MADENLFNINFDTDNGMNNLDETQQSQQGVIIVDEKEKQKDKTDSNLIIVDIPESKEKEIESNKVESSTKQKGSLLSPLAAAVKEEGILPNLDIEEYNKVEDDKKADYLIQQMEQEINASIDAYKNSLSPQGSKYLTMLENGITEEQAYQITAGQIKYKDLDEAKLKENVAMQEKVVYDYYKLTTRFSDEKIKGIIEDKKATSELEKEATSNLPEIQKIYNNAEKEALAQAKANEEANKAAAAKSLETLKSTIYDIKEIIPGMPLSKKDQDKLFEYATKPVGYTQDNQPVTIVQQKYMEDPNLVSVQLNYLAHLGLIGKNADWSKVLGAKKKNAVALLNEVIKDVPASQSGHKPSNDLVHKETEENPGDFFKGFPGLQI